MPHHSANSYRGRVTKVVGDRLDEWRKRSAIAFRKAQKTSQSTSSQPLVINTDVNYNAEVIELTSSPSPMSPRHEQSFTDTADAIASDAQSVLRHENKAYVKQDIEVVSQFFATLNDDGQEPEELVWARLANQVSEITLRVTLGIDKELSCPFRLLVAHGTTGLPSMRLITMRCSSVTWSSLAVSRRSDLSS